MTNATEEFRFAMLNNEPYAYACANNTPFTVGRTLHCPQPGAAYELFQVYVEAMRVKSKIMWITTEQLGSYENGTWTGALRMVLDGTLDTIAAPYQRTDLREQFFEFSSSFYDVKLAYLAKETKRSGLETIFDIFSPFSPNVWLTYLATILALVITLLFIDAGYSKATKQARMKSSSGFVAWNFFRILIRSCGQGIGQESLSMKIILFSGGLFALIMMNLYGNVLLSDIIYDRRQHPFKTADDVLQLIEQGIYKLINDRSSPSFWYHQETATSNETHYRQLRKALAKNPYAYADNETHALQKVLEGGHILPALTDDSIVFKANKLCEIVVIIPTDGPLKWAPYIFRNKSPFIDRFNTALYSTQRLTDRIWGVYFGEIARRKKAYYCKQPITLSPLSLETSLGIFALILIGFVLATVLFVAETARRKWTHQEIEYIDENLNEKPSRWRLTRKRTVSHSAVQIDTTADRLASRPSPLVISNVRGLQPDMFLSDFAGNGHSYSTAL